MSNFISKIATLTATCAVLATPVLAQHDRHDATPWTAAAVASAAVGVYGASHHDNGLTLLGAVGALYSLSRINTGHHCDDYGYVSDYPVRVSYDRDRYEGRYRPDNRFERDARHITIGRERGGDRHRG